MTASRIRNIVPVRCGARWWTRVILAARPGADFSNMHDARPLEPVRMTLRDRRDATIREVRLDDARAMRAAFERLSEVTRYYRFMAPLKELSPAMAERSV